MAFKTLLGNKDMDTTSLRRLVYDVGWVQKIYLDLRDGYDKFIVC